MSSSRNSFLLSASVILRMTRHGFPAATHQSGISSDDNFFAVFKAGISGVRMNRMSCCINGNIRSKLAVITHLYLCHIQDRAVVICKKVLSNFNIKSIITVKRWIDPCMIGFSKKLLYKFGDFVEIGAVYKIQLL